MQMNRLALRQPVKRNAEVRRLCDPFKSFVFDWPLNEWFIRFDFPCIHNFFDRVLLRRFPDFQSRKFCI
jgi:hypothetical protein